MERSRVCRICMTESVVVLSLFGEDAFWRKIVSFANVEIHENDPLPQQICMICARGVINASSLKQKCEDADKYFRRIAEQSGLSSTSTTQLVLEQSAIEVKNEPVDVFESTSSILVSPNQTSLNTAASHKPSRDSVNCRGFTSPEPSVGNQSNTTSPNKKKDDSTVAIPTMISIPIRNKVSDKPEAIVTPNQKSNTEPTLGSQPEKLAPIKLRYSSSTSSAQILSSPTNPTSSASLTNLPNESTPVRKKSPSLTKAANSTGVVKAKKRIKKNALSKSLSSTNAITTSQSVNCVTSTPNALPTASNALTKQCDVCGERFALLTILKHHMKVSHHIQTKMQCQKCNRSYCSSLALEKHTRSGLCQKKDQIKENTPSKGNLTCEHCRRTFPTGRHFSWHKRLSHCYGGKQERIKQKPTVLAVRPLSTLMTPKNDAQSTIGNTEEKQCKEDQGQMPPKTPLNLNRTDVVETTFRWNTSEFNAGGNFGNPLNISHIESSKSPEVKSKDKGTTNGRNELDENVDNTNTNQTLNPPTRKHAKPGRPRKPKSSLNLSKVRKPYVYMDAVKFEHAKRLVANGAVAADVSKQLNISPITAWRVCQCITKNIPLKFRRRRKGLVNVNSSREAGLNLLPEGADPVSTSSKKRDTVERALSREGMEIKREIETGSPNLYTSTPIIPKQNNKMLEKQLNIRTLTGTIKSQMFLEKQMESERVGESFIKSESEATNESPESTNVQVNLIPDLGLGESRLKPTVRRVKRAERKQAIMKEILTILREDRSAQYWKISNRLAEKGYHVTPPTICRKLKMLGIHRRSQVALPPKKIPVVQDA